jgi:ATP-dependent Clp protease protease subunit
MNLQKEFEKYAVKHKGISGNTLHSYQTKSAAALHTGANPYIITGLTPNIIECVQQADDGPYYFPGLSHKR